MTTFNKMQSLKRRFFAMRNGVVADTYRRAGSKFRIVFGLNLPQISEIAAEFGPDEDLAAELWRNRSTRESMLIAPMLLQADRLSRGRLMEMAGQIDDCEVADVFVHRLLRRRDDGMEIAMALKDSVQPMLRYVALRMAYSRVADDPQAVKTLAWDEIAKADPLTLRLARIVYEDAGYLCECRQE